MSNFRLRRRHCSVSTRLPLTELMSSITLKSHNLLDLSSLWHFWKTNYLVPSLHWEFNICTEEKAMKIPSSYLLWNCPLCSWPRAQHFDFLHEGASLVARARNTYYGAPYKKIYSKCYFTPSIYVALLCSIGPCTMTF